MERTKNVKQPVIRTKLSLEPVSDDLISEYKAHPQKCCSISLHCVNKTELDLYFQDYECFFECSSPVHMVLGSVPGVSASGLETEGLGLPVVAQKSGCPTKDCKVKK